MAATEGQGNSSRPPHQSVLYQEILYYLRPHSPERYIDGTLGAGGHAWGILNASEPAGKLLGLDLDPQALAIASQRLSVFNDRVSIVQASYTTLLQQMQVAGWESVAGIVLDLGVSSMQIDTPDRGFSFQTEGPLDMRFSPDIRTSASDLVNTLPESELDRERYHARRGTISGRDTLLVAIRHAGEHLGQSELTRDLWRAAHPTT